MTSKRKKFSPLFSVSPSVETANVATQSSVASDQGLGVSVATQSAAAESTDADQQTDQETDGAHSHNGTESSETDEENEKLRSQNQKLTGEQRNLLEKNQELCQQVRNLAKAFISRISSFFFERKKKCFQTTSLSYGFLFSRSSG